MACTDLVGNPQSVGRSLYMPCRRVMFDLSVILTRCNAADGRGALHMPPKSDKEFVAGDRLLCYKTTSFISRCDRSLKIRLRLPHI